MRFSEAIYSLEARVRLEPRPRHSEPCACRYCALWRSTHVFPGAIVAPLYMSTWSRWRRAWAADTHRSIDASFLRIPERTFGTVIGDVGVRLGLLNDKGVKADCVFVWWWNSGIIMINERETLDPITEFVYSEKTHD